MNRIYKKMELVKQQYQAGLISELEMKKMLRALDIELMGCDCL
jgi:hypothetical protein